VTAGECLISPSSTAARFAKESRLTRAKLKGDYGESNMLQLLYTRRGQFVTLTYYQVGSGDIVRHVRVSTDEES
jgi:hypothetical protein